MKKRSLEKSAIGAAVTVVLIALYAPAQQGMKVCVVDSQKAFQASSEGKKAVVQFQEREQRIKNELAKIDDQIRSLQTRMNTQRLALTEDALIQLQSDLEKKSTDRKRYEEDSSRDYQQFANKLLQKIRAEMIDIVNEIAKERGYDLIIDLASGGVAYFNPIIDITPEVIKRYDVVKR